MKKFFCLIIFIFFFLKIATNVFAANIGEKKSFYIDSNYDFSNRKEIITVLIKETSELYFYADETWWQNVSQSEVQQNLTILGEEFKNVIYPKLTSEYGFEESLGIDGDFKITVLIHPMKESSGGYFRSNDEYPKIQVTDSNEKEMIYLNADFIKADLAKSLLAHEFVHLITFNQKEKIKSVTEDVWLNEMRAEYSSALLGYDEILEGSNLQREIKFFIEDPSDSIIDWQEKKSDYGSVGLFAQYLADHYGKKIFSDSLKTSKTGIESINLALKQNGFKEDLAQIFADWVIALLLNDCDYNPKYCYLNKNLANFHISSQINFLPLSGESTLTFTNSSKSFAGNWFKIIGGNGNLKYSFRVLTGENYNIKYILKDKNGVYSVKPLELINNQSEINLKNFGTEITSLFVVPVFLTNNPDIYNSFSWTVSTKKNTEDPEIINSLLTRIEELKKQIAFIQAQINVAKGNPPCAFNSNLYFGQKGESVSCLQRFLALQGNGIYPEALVTGFFGSATKAAVIRFQEKYALEILTSTGLKNGTGYVGVLTRAKIKQLLTP